MTCAQDEVPTAFCGWNIVHRSHIIEALNGEWYRCLGLYRVKEDV